MSAPPKPSSPTPASGSSTAPPNPTAPTTTPSARSGQPLMSYASAIEWTQATWDPVTGCTQVSPGCDHCYALNFAERFRGVVGHPYEVGFDLTLRPTRIELPLRWREPRVIF